MSHHPVLDEVRQIKSVLVIGYPGWGLRTIAKKFKHSFYLDKIGFRSNHLKSSSWNVPTDVLYYRMSDPSLKRRSVFIGYGDNYVPVVSLPWLHIFVLDPPLDVFENKRCLPDYKNFISNMGLLALRRPDDISMLRYAPQESAALIKAWLHGNKEHIYHL